jgi:hypothetical protein
MTAAKQQADQKATAEAQRKATVEAEREATLPGHSSHAPQGGVQGSRAGHDVICGICLQTVCYCAWGSKRGHYACGDDHGTVWVQEPDATG